jgi:hypothetical protein
MMISLLEEGIEDVFDPQVCLDPQGYVRTPLV